MHVCSCEIITSPVGGVWSIVMTVFLSARSHNSKTTWPIFIFLCELPVATARSSSDSVAICYVLPVLCMMSCFYTMDQWARIKYCVIYFALERVPSIVMSMSVSLSVHLHNSKTAWLTSPNFLCVLPMAVAQSALMVLWYIMYFWFYGWCHVFILWHQWSRIKHDVIQKSSPGGSTSWTSDN